MTTPGKKTNTTKSILFAQYFLCRIFCSEMFESLSAKYSSSHSVCSHCSPFSTMSLLGEERRWQVLKYEIYRTEAIWGGTESESMLSQIERTLYTVVPLPLKATTSPTATSLQRPLSSILKIAVEERLNRIWDGFSCKNLQGNELGGGRVKLY